MVKYLLPFIVLSILFALWTYKGITQTGIHVDLARDLNFLSDLWIHKIVWLGPMTSANFPASPVYYYLLFPGLLLGGGNALSLIFSQAFFAFAALGLYAFFAMKKSLISALLAILAVGLSPWWTTASALPWNGYMYVAWVFAALTVLWFKRTLFISALLLGTAIAIDPVAVLAAPVLFYEWLAGPGRIKNLLKITAGLLLPWMPVLLFEIITRGFLIRQWLAHPSFAGAILQSGGSNISQLLNITGLSGTAAIIILITALLTAEKRGRYWMISLSLPFLFLLSVSTLKGYYLLGLVSALTFRAVLTLSFHTPGRIILILLILSYIQAISIPPLSGDSRSIPEFDNFINRFSQRSKPDKTKQYAVVSIRDRQNSTPQADDYRFFLRTKGFNVLGIDDYPKADILLLFIETPDFKWQNFEDWHIRRFGDKKFLSNFTLDGKEIVIYGRN